MRAQKFAKTIGDLSNLNTTNCHLMQYRKQKTKGKKKKKEKKKKRKEHEQKANKHTIY